MSGRGGAAQLGVHVALTTIAYLVALTYALSLGALVDMFGLIWPPAGVAVASLLLAPRRWWPVVLSTLFATQVVYDLIRYDADLLPAMLWASANFATYLLVPLLIVRWQAAPLDTVGRVGRFAVAVVVGSVPSGLLGAMGAALSGDTTPYAITAALWATGSIVGILMVVPAALVAAGRISITEHTRGELVAIVATMLVTSAALFVMPDHLRAALLDYVVLLPVVWAALRLRLAGAAIAILLTTNVALLGTVLGRGPYAAADLTAVESAALLRVFMLVVSVVALLIASRAQEGAASAGLALEREQLLAAVSHELRTPLTPIVGFSQLLLRARPDLDPDMRAWVQAIDRNGRHLTDLIDDLLLLSRASRDRLTVEPEVVALVSVLAEAVDDHTDAPIAIAAVDPDLRVWADPQHVRQILDNLVQNALRHGRPPVVLDGCRQDDWACLVVTDQGPGVPDEVVDRLFDGFAQPEVGDQRSSQGLGLGLAICAMLAASNGGTIDYEPNGEAGARFVVRLPLADGRRQPTRARVASRGETSLPS